MAWRHRYLECNGYTGCDPGLPGGYNEYSSWLTCHQLTSCNSCQSVGGDCPCGETCDRHVGRGCHGPIVMQMSGETVSTVLGTAPQFLKVPASSLDGEAELQGYPAFQGVYKLDVDGSGYAGDGFPQWTKITDSETTWGRMPSIRSAVTDSFRHWVISYPSSNPISKAVENNDLLYWGDVTWSHDATWQSWNGYEWGPVSGFQIEITTEPPDSRDSGSVDAAQAATAVGIVVALCFRQII